MSLRAIDDELDALRFQGHGPAAARIASALAPLWAAAKELIDADAQVAGCKGSTNPADLPRALMRVRDGERTAVRMLRLWGGL